jgi:hypothetical protein
MRLLVVAFLAASTVTVALAIDIDPARRVVPEKFTNPPGNRFSIFSGDPERVQRANEVNLADFSAELKLEPATFSLEQAKANPNKGPVSIKFAVKNNAKKSYTLSFPDSQRFDYIITDDKGGLVYQWSADKVFVQRTDMTIINGSERLCYADTPSVSEIVRLLAPGTYKVKMILSNYPEINAEGTLTVTP